MPTHAAAQVEIVAEPAAAPIVTQPAQPTSARIEPSPTEREPDDSDVAGYAGVGMWIEQMNLRS